MAFPLARTPAMRFALQVLLGVPCAVAICVVAAAVFLWPAATQSTRDQVGIGLIAVYPVGALFISYRLKRADAPGGVYWAGLALGTPPWLALVYFGVLR